MEKFKFKNIINPPHISDGGQSIGIALYAFYKKSKSKLEVNINNAYYGDRSNNEKKVFNDFGEFIDTISSLKVSQVVKDILYTPIVWFNARTELGPRALGNRNIFANPTNARSKNLLNEITKNEPWSPVDCIVLSDYKNNVFENAADSIYGFRSFSLRQEIKTKVPALNQVNNIRVQTISKDNNTLYNIISSFYKQTGIPFICSVSLCDKRKPLINSPDEVLDFCLRKNMQTCYINGTRVELKNNNSYTKKICKLNQVEIKLSEEEKADVLKELNPYNLSKEVLEFYVRQGIDLETIDIANKKGARQLQLAYKMYGYNANQLVRK